MNANVRETAAIAERDQILAILRESQAGLTAAEIGNQMVFVRVTPCHPDRRHGCAALRRDRSHHWGEHLGEGLDLWTRRGVLSWSVLPHLLTLRTVGLVTRIKVGHKVLWSEAH